MLYNIYSILRKGVYVHITQHTVHTVLLAPPRYMYDALNVIHRGVYIFFTTLYGGAPFLRQCTRYGNNIHKKYRKVYNMTHNNQVGLCIVPFKNCTVLLRIMLYRMKHIFYNIMFYVFCVLVLHVHV